MGKSKEISVQQKELVYKVYEYFRKLSQGSVEPIKTNETKTKTIERLSNISGFCSKTIWRIINEGEFGSQTSELTFVKKTRKPRKANKTKLPESTLLEIKSLLNNFHITEGKLVTVGRLQAKIQESLGVQLSSGSLRKVLSKIGYKFVKSQNNRLQLVEKPEIIQRRNNYLEWISHYRRLGRPIVYLDETYINDNYTTSKQWSDGTASGFKGKIGKGARFIIVHAGSENGFIPGALLAFRSKSDTSDYHGEMNSTNFYKWLVEQLVPNLPPKSVVVVDNASYHNHLHQPPPTAANRKDVIKEWLTGKVELDPAVKWTKTKLVEKLREIRPQYLQYKIDGLLKQHGHDILRLPPYHPNLNPIEEIWGIKKRRVAAENVIQKRSAVAELIKVHFEDPSMELWKACCEKTKRTELSFIGQSLDVQFDIEVNENEPEPEFVAEPESELEEFEEDEDTENSTYDDTTDTAEEGDIEEHDFEKQLKTTMVFKVK